MNSDLGSTGYAIIFAASNGRNSPVSFSASSTRGSIHASASAPVRITGMRSCIQPVTVDEWFELGCEHEGDGALQEAIEVYQQALLELCHDHAEAWNNLGVVLNDLRRHVEADKAFRVALRLGFVGAHFNLASLLDLLGRRADARQHWSAFARGWHGGACVEHAKRRLGETA
jgi:tetratricopeptide (TPR) repeat protein